MKKEEKLKILLIEYLTKNNLYIKNNYMGSLNINKIKTEKDKIEDFFAQRYIESVKPSFRELGPFLKYIAIKGEIDLIVPFVLQKMDKYTSIDEVKNYLDFNKNLIVKFLSAKKILENIEENQLVKYINALDSKADKAAIIDSYLKTQSFIKSINLQSFMWKYLNEIGFATKERKELFKQIDFENTQLFTAEENTSYVITIDKKVLANMNQEVGPNIILSNLSYTMKTINVSGLLSVQISTKAETTNMYFIIDTNKKDFIIHYLNVITNEMLNTKEPNNLKFSEGESFYNEQKALYEKKVLTLQINENKSKASLIKL